MSILEALSIRGQASTQECKDLIISLHSPSWAFLPLVFFIRFPDDADNGGKLKKNKNKMGAVIAKLDDKTLYYLHLENTPVFKVNV